MIRHVSEPPQPLPHSPKRVTGQLGRPASGCSETSFNLDTPLTPHFNSVTHSSDSPYSDRRTSMARNGTGEAVSPSSSFSENSHFTFNNGFNSAQERDICVFKEPPSRKLCCPLCKNVFKDPVITTCGHTFCKDCVMQSSDEICPIDKKQTKYIVDNIALSEQIGELLIYCKYGCQKTDSGYVVDPEKCPVIFKLAERYDHESVCDYAPMTCPNNPNCTQFLKRDLEEHLRTCNSKACPNHAYGCTYVDTKTAVEEHLKACSFNSAAREGNKNQDKVIEKLIQENKSAREDIDFLFTSLRGLSSRSEQLESEKDQLIAHVDRMSAELADARRERQMILEELDQLKQSLQTAPHQYSVMDPEIIIKCKGTCVGHDGPVWCLAINNDFLFSGASDNHVKVWDTSCNYKCVKTLDGHSGIVLALTVYGSRLYSGSQDTRILVWNIDKNFELEDTLEAHDNPVCTLAAARAMVFSGSLKTVKVWSADSGKHKVKKEITGFNHWVRALYATDKELYCGSYQTIEIYNLDTLEVTTTLKTYGGSVYSICVTDKHILCGTYEKVIHVWELATMEQVTTLQGHNGTVYALAWMSSPSGILVFSASYDRTIRVWSQAYMICKQTLIRHAGSVACLAVSKGRLFSGGIDSMVKVWQ